MARLIPLMLLINLALIALVIQGPENVARQSMFLLPAALVVTLALFLKVRRTRSDKPHRYGFMTHEDRPPLSSGERLRLIGLTDERIVPTDKKPDHPDVVVATEIRETADAWKSAAEGPLSDDEIRSLYQLLMYVDPGDRPMSRQPQLYLKDVRNAEAFIRLRKYTEDWRNRLSDPEAAFDAWLEEVGDPDVNHLLLNGWVRFLESLPGNDVNLWHEIATEFDGLDDRDRLDAVFWILEQPDCDLATASDVIRGFIYWGILDKLAREAKASGKWRYVDAFRDLIKRYNSGFYTRHSLPASAEAEPGSDCDLKFLGKQVAKTCKSTGMSQMPRPRGLFFTETPGPDPLPDGYIAPYAYELEAGLYLKFPGVSGREAS